LAPDESESMLFNPGKQVQEAGNLGTSEIYAQLWGQKYYLKMLHLFKVIIASF
jgi:hypothetical protein